MRRVFLLGVISMLAGCGLDSRSGLESGVEVKGTPFGSVKAHFDILPGKQLVSVGADTSATPSTPTTQPAVQP